MASHRCGHGGMVPALFYMCMRPNNPGGTVRCRLDGERQCPQGPIGALLERRVRGVRRDPALGAGRAGGPPFLAAAVSVPSARGRGRVRRRSPPACAACLPRCLVSLASAAGHAGHPRGCLAYSSAVHSMASRRPLLFSVSPRTRVPGSLYAEKPKNSKPAAWSSSGQRNCDHAPGEPADVTGRPAKKAGTPHRPGPSTAGPAPEQIPTEALCGHSLSRQRLTAPHNLSTRLGARAARQPRRPGRFASPGRVHGTRRGRLAWAAWSASLQARPHQADKPAPFCPFPTSRAFPDRSGPSSTSRLAPSQPGPSPAAARAPPGACLTGLSSFS